MHWHGLLRPTVIVGPALMAAALAMNVRALAAQACVEPYRVSREEIRQAISGHGAYSLTSTTTSMRFGAETLLAIVRRRLRESPGSTQLLSLQSPWFAAHQETAGVTYTQMSAAARAGMELRMIGQHLQAEPIPPSIRSGRVIPAELDNIILSCLAKQPSGRPASAEALVRRFEAMDQTMWSPEHARAWWEANLSSPEPAPSVAVSGSVTTRVRLPMGG